MTGRNRIGEVLAAALALGLFAGGRLCAQAPSDPARGRKESPERWLVLRPIPVAGGLLENLIGSPSEEAQKRRFDEDLLQAAGGESAVRPVAGAKVAIAGKEYEWSPLDAPQGIVDLKVGKDPEQFSIAYAWGEIEAPEAGKALLGVGSDDAVKVWVNGKLVHRNWVGRPARIDDDVAPVELRQGRNSLLLKVQNGKGSWGFACRLLGPEA